MCNCKNSKCLKLYCECFANGMQCNGCNCRDCLNNPPNADRRTEAMETILERNPGAFQPKIATATQPRKAAKGVKHEHVTAESADGMPLMPVHNKGCNCKKSHCLKKYCECFQAGIYCGEFCRCADCHNAEGSKERTALEVKGQATPVRRLLPVSPLRASAAAAGPQSTQQFIEEHVANFVSSNSHTPWSHLITSEVIHQLTRHLLETVSAESRMQQHKDASVIDALLSISSPQQLRKHEASEKHPVTPGQTSSRNGRQAPSSKKSLEYEFTNVTSPDAASSSYFPHHLNHASATSPQPPIATTSSIKQESTLPPRKLQLDGSGSELNGVAATSISAPSSRALPLSSLYLASTSRVTAAPTVSNGLEAPGTTTSSASSLLSSLTAAEDQRTRSLGAIVDSVPADAGIVAASGERKRKREDEEEDGVSGSATAASPSGGDKRVKQEPGVSAVPASDTAMDDTALLMCDESELASCGPQLDQVVQAEVTARTAAAAAVAAASANHANDTNAAEPSPEQQLERQQEKVVLDQVAHILDLFVARVASDREKQQQTLAQHMAAASPAAASAIPAAPLFPQPVAVPMTL